MSVLCSSNWPLLKSLCLGFLIVVLTGSSGAAADALAAPKNATGQIQELRDIPVELSATEDAALDSMVLPVPPNWIGDFESMKKRHLIRILVPYSKTFFYVDRGQQKGIDADFGKALEDWLNKNHPTKIKNQPWRVFFIPVKRDQLLSELLAGKGDIVGGGLTVTAGRQQTVDFIAPLASGVREAVVTGPGGPKLTKIEDLAGQEVTVRASSSYFEHLVALNAEFKAKGLPPMTLIAADEWLESEDILEMVNAGLVKMTVVDRYLAEIWQPLFTDLQIHDDFYLNAAGELAWAIRKSSPQLMKQLNSFMKLHKVGTVFGNIMVGRYVKNEKRVVNATSAEEMRKFKLLLDLFRKHGKTYNFDYLMLTAQGYQESRLDQKARSGRGAVGIMQLLPSTAADPAVGISGIDKDAERNIEAGAKYMRLLADKYLNDPELSPVNRTLMTFAAYNAGPGNLRKFRRLAEKSGKDPNIWFQNVEYGAARIVGQETVNYVSNIYKYYLAYKFTEERQKASGQK